ncbi:trifunctional serine/threonine-protein kinase/ATP-binding protein/sensor histidine kinase [Hyalangium gracile]|uniref:trifunctional serine/threonine-protein kinase/ATP-binding protein/sensor histidine kinase n=1 Tax=Hyalangium gracile TaxID=394092 RepID=UPI001CCDEB4D|nr:trifunctional serine/threonine-protein kinase/ATP-binding protein/sensor histidine kinase [Hyalangium gracile]
MFDIPGFRLLSTVRETGGNILFHALREADGLSCILKTPVEVSPGAPERERYRREFGILQRLRDARRVTRAHACEQIQERPVLLLEKVEGQSLSESVGQPLPIPQFLALASALASALAEIHQRGVIHKDLKPSNIIIEPSGEPRLIDFGAATLQQIEHLEAAPANQIEGTLPYMSPEQTGRMNRVVDYRTDFYSLGVTLYELLTGMRPFRGRDALEWFHAHMTQRPKPPEQLVSGIPPAVSAIVLKLLAKVAEERYQSAEGLRADLEQCREGLLRGALEGFQPGAHDTPNRFQLPQRLYGREADITALLEGFERVVHVQKPELILISGYSGIGKSSVVQELLKPVVQRRGLFLSGKFDQFQRDVPYATLAQAIRELVRHLLASTDEELAAWRQRLLRAFEGEGRILVDLVPQLELVVGALPAGPELPPPEAQNRFNRVFRRFLSVFATAQHPLVVFLDDLQWADPASLVLVHHLLTQPEPPPVLWIGAYRDNEVSPSHALVPALEGMRKAGARLTELRLEPLSLEQVQQLVGDALPGASREVIVPLSALSHEKTGGNPFFLIQWLVTLYQEGLLARTPEAGWRWDAERVRARGYSDNVVDFLAGRLRQLPSATQRTLRLAACVGSRFPLSMVGTLSEMGGVEEVERTLEPALLEGVLMRGGPEELRFLHDRLQQAAQALGSEEESQRTHLHIGRLLLRQLSSEQAREKIFDVVSQLNAGAKLIEEPAERHQVARLNAEAGAKAMASVAYRPAISYFTAALALVPGDPWETDPELAFKVQLERGRCELMSGNAPESRRLMDELRKRARSHADLAAASFVMSEAFIAMGQAVECVTCLLECLAVLGHPMSAHPSWEEAVAAHREMKALLGTRSIASLVELPPMTDPDVKVVMGVLQAMYSAAYFTDKNLLLIVLSRLCSLSIQYGFAPPSVIGFSWMGVMSGSLFKQYREGEAWGVLARELLDRYDLAALRGRVLFSLLYIFAWTRPLPAVQEMALSALHHSLQVGDFLSAPYICSTVVSNHLLMGHNLDDLHQESMMRAELLRKAGVTDPQALFLISLRYIQQLRGRTRSFDTLDGDSFDEKAFEASLTAARMSVMLGSYWLTKLKSRFMCGAYAQAREAAQRVKELLEALTGNIQILDYHLYRALTLAACFERVPAEEQGRLLEDIQRHQQQLAEWAALCPETFRGPERLVSAELARLTGRLDEATGAYEEAYQAAREGGFTQNVGLAAELAANFWRMRNAPVIAINYAREAREAYLKWGAWGKVQHLEAQWQRMGPARSAGEASSTNTESTRIDALTVVKAQQAISGEIVLERLVTTLMQVAIENAGAQRGALLLQQAGTLSVAATSGAETGGPSGPEGEGTRGELPWTLLAYVRRTHEHVLIGDASKPHPFSADPWFQRVQARSVLCLPLLRKESFYGALFLENDLATNAFTPARLALLSQLAAQAAISIENARLYGEVQRAETALRRANDELEQRVAARTRQLEEAQARLVDTAREVGMAEVASNVLHNVGNVLTSAVINLEMMRKLVDSSRVGRLGQVTAMLREHRARLVDFLTQDPRGSHLPDYLEALSEELLREQQSLRGDLQTMSQHVEHIRSIVQVQQAYASAALLREQCDLSVLIGDALRIQEAALERHGVTITQELSKVPMVLVDRHKVLQILINLLSNAKNALGAMPEGQRNVRVRLGAEGGMARIQVVDNGTGFAPEVRPQLFRHGFTTRKDGHGFGLHASALAAQMLGGRLTLESEGPGRGATATLEIPLG